MSSIIYDIAVSIDGYIAGPGGDISGFAQGGPIVDDYMTRLQTYSCAIMGRATYEFGYRFGMAAGDNPYPHMDCYVFSKTLQLPGDSGVHIIRDNAESFIAQLKQREDGPIYLCGGGAFAGALLGAGLIDIVRLKRAPAILGGGAKLFGENAGAPTMECAGTKLYDDGYLFQEFRL